MAGAGPAPKEAEQRRRAGAPQRGDWIELPPLPRGPRGGKLKLPLLPERGKGRGPWSRRTRRAWESWWGDQASTQWGPADVDLLEHLADVFEEWVREPRANMASEIRQLRDSLGLTPKGKQDRRWRVPFVEEPTQAPAGVTAIDAYRKRLGR